MSIAMAKRRVTVLVSMLVIITAEFGCSQKSPVKEQTYCTAAEVLAAETTKLLSDKGQIVVVAYDTTTVPVPYATAQLDAFKKSLKLKRHVSIAAVESVGLNKGDLALAATLDGKKYGKIISQHAGIDAIVSLVGPPVLTDAEMQKLPSNLPKCLVFGGSPVKLKRLFREDIVQVAVVRRFTPIAANAPEPRTNEERFNREYEVVTSATAGSLGD